MANGPKVTPVSKVSCVGMMALLVATLGAFAVAAPPSSRHTVRPAVPIGPHFLLQPRRPCLVHPLLYGTPPPLIQIPPPEVRKLQLIDPRKISRSCAG